MRQYNLLDEPWLPVRLADGTVVQLGLLSVFARSHEIIALAETAPPSLVAQYRLLLAILHRALHQAFTRWDNDNRADWYADGLPTDEVCAYLEHWRERFWLFHPDAPFLQVAALASAPETGDKRKPWTQIALASASGNTPVVFDHAYDANPVAITPADAVRTLLGFLQFTPGGLVKAIRDADKAGPLANTAAVIPLGATLAQTLCLAVHPAPAGHGEPDLPAWERAPLTAAQLREDPTLATGPNDRYTRQSRAVLLCPEEDGTVRWLHFAAGHALAEDPHAPDPMASFRVGTNGLVRLTFVEGRAVWRDLPTLVPEQGGGARAAASLEHAITLHLVDMWHPPYQPLLVAGVASDQAKMLRWRAEQVMLPAPFLREPDKVSFLGTLLREAESLFADMRKLATRMLAEALPDSASKDTLARARSMLNTGPFTTTYFSALEQELPALLQELGSGDVELATQLWHQAMKAAAMRAWNSSLTSLGKSVKALRADGKYSPRFHGFLQKRFVTSQTVHTEEA